MEDPRKATVGELDNAQRTKDRQMQGGTDLDTTQQDKPAGLEREKDDLIRDEDQEYGPLTTVPAEKDSPNAMDPSGEDPFVPGTAEGPENFDPEALMSDREKQIRDEEKHEDPRGTRGPTYEVGQGTNFRGNGGTTDPNSDLTEDTSGYQRE